MSGTKLYTIVLDYGGGTYISQVQAQSPVAAFQHWGSTAADSQLAEWRITRDELKALLESDHPVPINGLMGVWCATGSARKGLALVNIVATMGQD